MIDTRQVKVSPPARCAFQLVFWFHCQTIRCPSNVQLAGHTHVDIGAVQCCVSGLALTNSKSLTKSQSSALSNFHYLMLYGKNSTHKLTDFFLIPLTGCWVFFKANLKRHETNFNAMKAIPLKRISHEISKRLPDFIQK